MRRLIIPVIIFAAFCAYYGFLASPNFYFWDSAELTAAVLGNGVPHPPGFPLLLLLASLWRILAPFKSPQGLNFFSGAFAAAGLALWYLVIVKIMKLIFDRRQFAVARIAASLTIIAMGISFSYSIQAVRFEVYSLNFVMFALMFYVALRIDISQWQYKLRYAVLFLVMGLALGAHILTAALAIPGILLILIIHKRIHWRVVGMGILGALLTAAALYFRIFDLALHQPPLNWGDPSSFKGFYNYIFVTEFSAGVSSFNMPHITDNLIFVIKLMMRQIGALGLLLAVSGLIFLLMRKLYLGIGLLVILVLNIFSSIFMTNYFYENLDLQGYHIITLSVLALFVAIGLKTAYNFLRSKSARKDASLDRKALALTILLALLTFGYPVYENFLAADLSQVDGEYYAELFLEKAPTDAVVLTSYYNTYFCLMALDSYSDKGNERLIQNIYNWDHRWGREQTAVAIDSELPLESGRQDFYRNALSAIYNSRPVYIEYDDSSRPLVRYLVPSGMGYLFVANDSLAILPDSCNAEIANYMTIADKTSEIEWIKTWVLWFNNRGNFYNHRGNAEFARAYFDAAEKIASRAALK